MEKDGYTWTSAFTFLKYVCHVKALAEGEEVTRDLIFPLSRTMTGEKSGQVAFRIICMYYIYIYVYDMCVCLQFLYGRRGTTTTICVYINVCALRQ